jgi:hypothetical protein
MFRSVHSVALCFSVYCLCVNVHWTTATGISGHFSTTVTKVLPCLFLSCKANSRVYLAKTGHGPHFPNVLFLLLSMFHSLYSVYYLCVNVYYATATGCQPNCSYIYKYIYIYIYIYTHTYTYELNFVSLYFLNYAWYVKDLHNI